MQIPSCDKITNFMVTVIGTGSNSLHNGLNGFLQLVEGVQLHHHDGRHPHLWHFSVTFITKLFQNKVFICSLLGTYFCTSMTLELAYIYMCLK